MINNGGVDVTNVIMYGLIALGLIVGVLIIAVKHLYDFCMSLEAQFKAITPEHRALTHAYFKTLYEEYKKVGGNINGKII